MPTHRSRLWMRLGAVLALLLLLLAVGLWIEPVTEGPGHVSGPRTSDTPQVPAPTPQPVAPRNVGWNPAGTPDNVPSTADNSAVAPPSNSDNAPPTEQLEDEDAFRFRVLDADGQPVAARVWFWPTCVSYSAAEHLAKFGVPPLLDVPPSGVILTLDLGYDAVYCFGHTAAGAIIAVEDDFTSDVRSTTVSATTVGTGFLDPALGDPVCWRAWRDHPDDMPDVVIADVQAHDASKAPDQRNARKMPTVEATLNARMPWPGSDSSGHPADSAVVRARPTDATVHLGARGPNLVASITHPDDEYPMIVRAVSDTGAASPWRELDTNRLDLVLLPAATVVFWLMDADGSPLGNADLMVDWTLVRPCAAKPDDPFMDDGYLRVATQADGSVRLGTIPAGLYDFVIQVYGRGLIQMNRREIVAGASESIVLTIVPYEVLELVLQRHGQPAHGVEAEVELRCLRASGRQPTRLLEWNPATGGRMRIRLGEAGRWKVIVKSLVLGSVDLGEFVVEDEQTVRMEGDLTQTNPQLQILVQPAELLADVTARLIDPHRKRPYGRRYTVPPNGVLEPGGLDEGDYLVLFEGGDIGPTAARFRVDANSTADPPTILVRLMQSGSLVLRRRLPAGATRATIAIVDSNGYCRVEPFSLRHSLKIAPGPTTVWLRPWAQFRQGEDFSRGWLKIAETTVVSGETRYVELPPSFPVPAEYCVGQHPLHLDRLDPSGATVEMAGPLDHLPAGTWHLQWTDDAGAAHEAKFTIVAPGE